VFSQFIDLEFDAKTHATRIIQSHAISQQLAKLAEGINLLDRQLHSQVAALHCVSIESRFCMLTVSPNSYCSIISHFWSFDILYYILSTSITLTVLELVFIS